MSVSLRGWPLFAELSRRAREDELRGRVEGAQEWRDIRWRTYEREFVSGNLGHKERWDNE